MLPWEAFLGQQVPAIKDCHRNNSGTTPCEREEKVWSRPVSVLLWLQLPFGISLKCCSHLVLGDFTAGATSWCWNVWSLLLHSRTSTLRVFSWPLLCCLFCQEWQEGLPWFWKLQNWSFPLISILEDWNFALDEGSPRALIWHVLTCISWHILAFFFFPLCCISFFWPLGLCVSNGCYLPDHNWLKSLSADNTCHRECFMFSWDAGPSPEFFPDVENLQLLHFTLLH